MVIKIRRKYLISITLSLIIIIIFTMVYRSDSAISLNETEDGSVYLPIIMYHQIKPFKLGKDIISPFEFESDLKYLKENNYNAITMTQLIDFIYNDGALPENPIILTFDDGYLNNYKYAFPLLKKYEMKMVFSIIGKNTDDFTRIPDDNIDYSHVTWDQLKEMLDSGYIEVQNHTYNLHHIKQGRIGCGQKSQEDFSAYEQVLSDDVIKLQGEIETFTGQVPNTVAYPYGKYNDNTEAIIKKLGFKATLSCDYGINVITKDPETLFNLKRICRSHGSSIKKVLKQGYKTVK